MTDLNPVPVRLLINRIRDIQSRFGTLTDKLQLSDVQDAPWVYASDLVLFKQIVENGVMVNPLFRSPKGYEVLGFLRMLHDMQEAAFEEDGERIREEMIAVFETMDPERQDKLLAWQEKSARVPLSFNQLVAMTHQVWAEQDAKNTAL